MRDASSGSELSVPSVVFLTHTALPIRSLLARRIAAMAPGIQALDEEQETVRVNGHGENGYEITEAPLGTPRKLRVITIGAGASGLNLARQIEAHMDNVEHVVYEKNTDVGGTWFENRYAEPTAADDRTDAMNTDTQVAPVIFQVITTNSRGLLTATGAPCMYSSHPLSGVPNGDVGIVIPQPQKSSITLGPLRTNTSCTDSSSFNIES